MTVKRKMNWIREQLLLLIAIAIIVAMLTIPVWAGEEHRNTNTPPENKPVEKSVTSGTVSQNIKRVPSNDNKGNKQYNKREQSPTQESERLKFLDHIAQINMAVTAWIGIVLGVFGAGLLYFTLRYTRDAAKAAGDTLNIARNATKAEFQPYLKFTKYTRLTKILRSGKIQYDTLVVVIDAFEIANVGKTPVSNLNISTVGKFYDQRQHFEEKGIVLFIQAGDMNPNDTWDCAIEFQFNFPDGNANHFEGIKEFDICVSVSFSDMFAVDEIRRYEIHYLYAGLIEGAEIQSVKEIKQA
jgi:hypothetical protein